METTTTPAEQSNARPGLRKPVFAKVDQLKPGTTGHTLIVKVLSSNTVLQKGRSVSQHLRQTRIAECVVGDETGTIVFTARNDQGIVFRSWFFFFIIIFFSFFSFYVGVSVNLVWSAQKIEEVKLEI